VKVLLISPRLSGGGAERVAVDLASGLAITDEVYLYTFEPSGIYSNELADGVQVIGAKHGRMSRNLIDLIRLFRSLNPDCVISTQSYVGTFTVLCKKILRASRIQICVRESSTPSISIAEGKRPLLASLTKKIIRWTYREANLLIAPCDHVRDDILRFTASTSCNVHTLYNPVDSLAIHGHSKEKLDHQWFNPARDFKTILAIGRLDKVKDHRFLIRCFSKVAQKLNVKLAILGEGPEREDLQSYINRKGLHDDVALLGFDSNPFKYIKNADLVALTSLYEGYPNVLLHSKILQTAALALDSCGGVGEILSKNAILPHGDEIAFAQAIETHLELKLPTFVNENNYESNISYSKKLRRLISIQ
jgi:glycosyltransferase involved in cell wall biosynthesis